MMINYFLTLQTWQWSNIIFLFLIKVTKQYVTVDRS